MGTIINRRFDPDSGPWDNGRRWIPKLHERVTLFTHHRDQMSLHIRLVAHTESRIIKRWIERRLI